VFHLITILDQKDVSFVIVMN